LQGQLLLVPCLPDRFSSLILFQRIKVAYGVLAMDILPAGGHRNDKSFLLVVKFFSVMGLTWNIASWVLGVRNLQSHATLWYLELVCGVLVVILSGLLEFGKVNVDVARSYFFVGLTLLWCITVLQNGGFAELTTVQPPVFLLIIFTAARHTPEFLPSFFGCLVFITGLFYHDIMRNDSLSHAETLHFTHHLLSHLLGCGLTGAILIATFTLHARLENKLKRALRELQTANESKDVFLNKVTHEVRTPLAAISGYCDMMRDGGPIEKHHLDSISNCCQSALDLVSEVLDWSRIRSNHLSLHIQRFHLIDVLSKSTEMVSPQMKSKEIHFKLNPGKKTDALYGDHSKITQVLVCLLSNATKFTQHGGNIECNVEKSKEGDYVYLKCNVVDDGAGFEGDGDALFEPFRQGGAPGVDGVGLGLAIAHEIIIQMGGKMWAHSDGLYRGATFGFALKLKTKHQISNDMLVEREVAKEDSRSFKRVVEQRRRRRSAPCSTLNVLYVEDTEMLQKVLKRQMSDLCQSMGIQLNMVCIAKASEAFELMAQNMRSGTKRFHLIFLDICLGSELDGMDLCMLVRHREEFYRVEEDEKATIIMITALTDDKPLSNVQHDGRLIKPVKKHQLRDILESASQKSNAFK